MTNFEKYKTAQERIEAFRKFCDSQETCCTIGCPANRSKDISSKWQCAIVWLDLEAEEEKPLPCPFCGRPTIVTTSFGGLSWVQCEINCGYSSHHSSSKSEAIAVHNRVAKAVKESNETK